MPKYSKSLYRLVPCFILVITLCLPQFIIAQQNVGIGTPTPNAFSMLDISSSNKGLLIPRMALTSTTSNAPVGAFVAGMMVYNTATTGDVTPGFYLCNGTKWEKAGGGWNLTGNSGTSPATNFIGTIDDQDVIFKRNNQRAGLINISTNQTSFGVNALHPSNTGFNNTAIGKGAMITPGISNENTAVGYAALNSNTTGSANTAMGSIAMYGNTTGSDNIGIGFFAMDNNKAGNWGIAIGNYAMKNANNTTTAYTNSNIAIGTKTLHGSVTIANNTGLGNNVIGLEAMYLNSSGSRNNALGTQTLYNNTTGSGNIAIGFRSLYSNTNRSDLVAIGDSALYNNGTGASQTYHSVRNTAIGAQTLLKNTVGDENTALGYQALYSNVGGYFNSAIGSNALRSNQSGVSNVAIGSGALIANTGGSDNIAIGINAGGVGGGSGNVFLGKDAGYYETGSQKLYISNSSAGPNDALIFGEFGTKKLRVNNILGIGRLPASYPLEIKGDAGNGLLKFFNNTDVEKWHFRIEANNGLGIAETGIADRRIVLAPGGNIGFGTSNAPETELHIVNGTAPTIKLQSDGVDEESGRLALRQSNNTGIDMYYDGFSSFDKLIFEPFISGTSQGKAMAIDLNGNVSIGGTKVATGHKLSVDGKVACTEVRVEPSASWPDYVFESDYNLLPLDQLEKVIENNKHLPGIPSAKDIANNGLEVGEMQRKMMEKIEELTLYIIDLNKKIDSLSKENKEQAEQIKEISKQ